MTNKEYAHEKAKFSYELFLRNKLFKKARVIVKKEDKFLLLNLTSHGSTKNLLLAGGGVDEGETVQEAAMREAKEELGVNCKIVKYLGKDYYNTKLTYNGQSFVSHRVEYFYLCEFISNNSENKVGIDGEFNDSVSVIELTNDEFKKAHIIDFKESIKNKVFN